jgi:small subunit ribosomal protein S16
MRQGASLLLYFLILRFFMVIIRLSRSGSKKRPFYNIVATDSRNPLGGRFNERIGYYNPMASGQATRLFINEASLNSWVSKGAQMSDTVARLYKEFKKTAAAAAE